MALGAPPTSAVNADHGTGVVSTNPANTTPHVMNGTVKAITQIGNKIVAAGTFTSVSPAATFSNTADDVVRNRIFAFDATTGVIDPTFNPNLGGDANSLDTDGTFVYVGGAFSSVGGNTAIKRIVKLTATGAVVSTFQALPNKPVNEVVVRGARVYLGGAFTSVKNGNVTFPRGALAALDSTTGAVLAEVNVPFTGLYNGAGGTNIVRFDVSPDGTRLAAVGNFSTVGGLPRVQLALVDTGAPAAVVAPWATNRFDAHTTTARPCSTPSCATSTSPPTAPTSWSPRTGAFAGGAATGTLCDTTTRWETASTGNDPTWADYTGGDTTYGVAVTGSAVYVGGHMRWQNNPFQGDQAGPGAVPRDGIAALDPVNGLPLSWNPGRARGVGAQAMFATASGPVGRAATPPGSAARSTGGSRSCRSPAAPRCPPSRPPPCPTTSSSPSSPRPAPCCAGRSTRTARRPAAARPPTRRSTGRTLRGGFLVNGTLYYGLTDGRLYKRTFNRTTGAVGSQTAVNLYDDPDNGSRIPFAISTMTGSFYDPATHRIYYTTAGDSRLYYRYFTPESEVVGAQTFELAPPGVSFATVAGMTLAGGRILYGSSADGALRSLPFADGQVAGAPTVVSSDGTWRYRAIFVPN